jgi:hypothetical protein
MVSADSNLLQDNKMEENDNKIENPIYELDRFDAIRDEANLLYLDGEDLLAKKKLDEYIEKVFFPRDCKVIDLYVSIFSNLEM